MGVMGLPDQVQIECAPGYGRAAPSSIPDDAWVSLSIYTEKSDIKRGTNHELNQPESGTLTLSLNNESGVLCTNVGGWSNSGTLVPGGTTHIPLRQINIEDSVDYPRYFGYVASWGPSTVDMSDWRHITAVCYDSLAAAEEANMCSSYLGAQYLAHTAIAWYRCEETADSSTPNPGVNPLIAYDSSGNGNNGMYSSGAGLVISASAGSNPYPDYQLAANSLLMPPATIAATSGLKWTACGWLHALTEVGFGRSGLRRVLYVRHRSWRCI
jgi:hypothetical protein